MGLLRFLLAAAVALGHGGVSGWLTPYYAVQAFFVISGFYMALIHQKYVGQCALFYVNRYSRLIVSYWIVALVTFVFWWLHPTITYPVSNMAEVPPLSIIANLTLFGMDAVNFFHETGWLFVPQAWSLGAELSFYLLVPFLAVLSTRALLWIVALSVTLRLAIVFSDLPFFPWQQRLFPAELALFVVGMLAYRKMRPNMRFGLLSTVAAAAAVALIGRWQLANDPNVLGTALLAAGLYISIPRIFALTRHSRVDRFIGEFSYPIYLWHVFVLMYIGDQQHQPVFSAVLGLSVLLSLPIVILVEMPMEKWRSARLAKAHAAPLQPRVADEQLPDNAAAIGVANRVASRD